VKYSSRQKRIILHIGIHKTGSTAIQTGLWINRRKLLRHGIDYPLIGLVGRGHHNIAYDLQGDQRYIPAFGNVRSLLRHISRSRAHTIIVSAEDFCDFDRRHVRQTAELLQPYEVQIAVYLRRQDQLMQAMWAQQVKSGILTLSFNEWFDSLFQRRIDDRVSLTDLQRLDFEALLNSWAECFGPEAIKVRPYERSRLNDDLMRDFSDLVGMALPAEIRFQGHENVTPDISTLEVMRELAKRSGQEAVARYRTTHHIFRSWVWPDVIKEYAPPRSTSKRLELVDKARYHFLSQRYGPGNDAVARRYLGQERLFSDEFHPGPPSRPTLEALSPELINRLRSRNVSPTRIARGFHVFRVLLMRHPSFSEFMTRHWRYKQMLKKVFKLVC